MHKKLFTAWNFLLFFIGYLLETQSGYAQSNEIDFQLQKTERETKTVFAQLGGPISFRWYSAQRKTIDYCRWDSVLLNENSVISVISTINNSIHDKYSINKNGLNGGFCELTIQNVQSNDFTLWNVTIIDKDPSESGLGITYGTVKLVYSAKPSKPYLNKNKLQNLTDANDQQGNNIVDVICCVNGENPPPELIITIRNHTSNEKKYSSHENGANVFGSFCLRVKIETFTWIDNEKYIVCQAKHEDYEDSDITEDSLQLNIFHGPKIFSNINDQNEIDFISGSRVFVEFSANPFPKIEWLMKTELGKYEHLPENYNHILVQNLTNRSWDAELILSASEMSSNSEHFLLVIKNPYGYKEIYVNVYKPSGIQWIFVYVGAGIGILAIIVLLAVIITRRNGWLCFQYRTGKFKSGTRYDPPTDIDEATVPMRNDNEAGTIVTSEV